MTKSRKKLARRSAGPVVGMVLALLSVTAPAPARGTIELSSWPVAGNPSSWPAAGNNVQGDRSQPADQVINPSDAGRLKMKWFFTDHASESATPTVADGVVYFPDFGGYLYALSATTGSVIWEKKISDYENVPGVISRTSPVVVGNEIILGDNFPPVDQPTGAHLLAINRWTGKLIWITQVSSHPAAKITGSPVAFGTSVYVPVSSNDELINLVGTAQPDCCTSRGSIVSVNAFTGSVNWRWYDIPADLAHVCQNTNPFSGCGYSGAAIWSTPAIDPSHDSISFGTGNNYTVPDSVLACETQAQQNGTSDANCADQRDYFDSVISLDLRTGKLDWAYRTIGFDAFPTNTTGPAGADYDFGSGPNVFTTAVGGRATTVVGIGQKSGIYYVFGSGSGALLWKTRIGPGGFGGGIEFGTATDGVRVYAPEADVLNLPYTLQPSGQPWSAGSWSALDAATGKILWQTADPSSAPAYDHGPPTVVNGVLFAGSVAPSGSNMYALDAANGQILWSFASGGSVAGGPAVVGGSVYWGSGYAFDSFLGGTGNNTFYAFTVQSN